ncbi:MAG: YaiI/YqxD family protein [Deltaproteobacteria bacterium]|nr:YaiI/YqxD family protein [Deltaproteobacteria bacterium]
MRIWLDNDGCPQIVRDIVFKASQKRRIAVAVVANRYMHVPAGGIIQMIAVSGAFDAADNYIAENAVADDLVITADIPLASRIVEKGCMGLNPRGEIYTEANIRERLAMRNLMQELRSGGEIQGGPAPLGDLDKKRFADAFDRVVTSLISKGG